jgi:hypothetical protein
MIEKLRIGWKDFDIIEKEPDEDLISGGNFCYGRIRYDDQQILLNSNYSEAQKTTTLIHEAMHALDDAYDLELTERQVVCLGNGIASLIADNPELLEELKALYKSTSE